jgi:hypothetical protein
LEEKTEREQRFPDSPQISRKKKRIPRQPKRAQQIAKLRLFVWDMMR